jgi:hypothetical protein
VETELACRQQSSVGRPAPCRIVLTAVHLAGRMLLLDAIRAYSHRLEHSPLGDRRQNPIEQPPSPHSPRPRSALQRRPVQRQLGIWRTQVSTSTSHGACPSVVAGAPDTTGKRSRGHMRRWCRAGGRRGGLPSAASGGPRPRGRELATSIGG